MRKTLPALSLSILLILALLAGVYGLFMGLFVRPAGEIAVTAERVCNMLVQYITTHGGEFPASKEELLSSQLLVKRASFIDGRRCTEYYHNFELGDANTPNGSLGSRLYRFEALRILYGAQRNEIKESGGVLYDSNSRKRLLLISGPYTEGLGADFYLNLSLRLYRAMQEASADRGGIGP